MATDYGATLMLVTLVLFIVCLFLGITVDMRIFLLYFALICLIGPIWLAWLYCHYGLRGQCYLNVVNHIIDFDSKGLTVRLQPVKDEEREEDVPEPEEWWNRSFGISELGRWRIAKNGIVIGFIDRKEGFLYLPLDVLASPQEMEDVIQLLSAP